MIESPDYTLSVYGISKKGFLPDDPPLEYLSNPCFGPWEETVRKLPELIRNDELRATVDVLPDFDTHRLNTQADWRRSYVIFSFLTHAYIWGGQQPAETLPPKLSIPFSVIADHFALPTTATYAGLNLWNWKPVMPNADITVPENIRMMHTFTGTSDEAWFYLISVAIEARGGSIIATMLECFEAIRVNNAQMVVHNLNKINDCLCDLGRILDRMHEHCDPTIFYHRIRPFLAGSKGMSAAGLPNGVFYDEGQGSGRWRQYSGGSNAQSSLIQLFDIVLGIVHHASGEVPTRAVDIPSKAKQSYIMEMRNYMPGSHRHFLAHVSSIANIKPYVMREGCEVAVQMAYHTAVQSLTTFRDKHIRIVSRYIIAPAQQLKSGKMSEKVNIATVSCKSSDSDGGRQQLCGTGGTALMPFLKQTRDETRSASTFA